MRLPTWQKVRHKTCRLLVTENKWTMCIWCASFCLAFLWSPYRYRRSHSCCPMTPCLRTMGGTDWFILELYIYLLFLHPGQQKWLSNEGIYLNIYILKSLIIKHYLPSVRSLFLWTHLRGPTDGTMWTYSNKYLRFSLSNVCC